MTRPASLRASLGTGLLAGLAGCAGAGATANGEAAEPQVSYLGIEARALAEDLVQLRVALRSDGPRPEAAAEAYARCAAAGYTLSQGHGFARHLRTTIEEEGGIWRADAVYTISPELPPGLQPIDARKAAAGCAEKGIPTV